MDIYDKEKVTEAEINLTAAYIPSKNRTKLAIAEQVWVKFTTATHDQKAPRHLVAA